MTPHFLTRNWSGVFRCPWRSSIAGPTAPVDPLKRHLAAFDLWEASLLLLASTAIVEYAERADPDPQIVEKLKNLARPHLGQWWELVRLLVPALASQRR